MHFSSSATWENDVLTSRLILEIKVIKTLLASAECVCSSLMKKYRWNREFFQMVNLVFLEYDSKHQVIRPLQLSTLEMLHLDP